MGYILICYFFQLDCKFWLLFELLQPHILIAVALIFCVWIAMACYGIGICIYLLSSLSVKLFWMILKFQSVKRFKTWHLRGVISVIIWMETMVKNISSCYCCFLNWDYFEEIGRSVDFVMKDTLSYWETEVQTNVANMISAAENDECGTAGTGQSWLGNFLRYNSSTHW